MKRVEVLLPPPKLDEVREALSELGLDDMTLTEVKIVEPRNHRRTVYRGSTYIVDFSFKIKMELVVGDDTVPALVEAVRKTLGSAEAEKTQVLLFEVVATEPSRVEPRGPYLLQSARV